MNIFAYIVKKISWKINRMYDAYKYNDETIAEKFRAQGAKIGKDCYLQIRSLAAEPYLVEIGNSVAIALGVDLITHDGASVIFRDEMPQLRYYGKIVIEDNCFIGRNAIITAGVRIGKDSIIGPMAVVINDVKPGSVMIGNPAIRISTTDKYKEKCLQKWKEQGMDKFNHLFEGKSKYEVQRIMTSETFLREMKMHLLAIDI